VKTEPINHNLCGNIVYEPRYNGEALNGEVLAYDSDTREFTVESGNEDLVGEIVPYSVIATLADYPRGDDFPDAPSAENGANILFNNPCNDPFSFAAST
jgi:hypothetical protein